MSELFSLSLTALHSFLPPKVSRQNMQALRCSRVIPIRLVFTCYLFSDDINMGELIKQFCYAYITYKIFDQFTNETT